jgi:hypothetical protein
VLDDVTGAAFDSVKAQCAADTPFFVLRQVTDFVAHNCPGLPDTHRDQVDSEQL